MSNSNISICLARKSSVQHTNKSLSLPCTSRSDKITNKNLPVKPRRVIPSKNPPSTACCDRKCVSAGKITTPKRTITANKSSTHSDSTVSRKSKEQPILDLCKKCGDSLDKSNFPTFEKNVDLLMHSYLRTRQFGNKEIKLNVQNRGKPIQQYYKNENFGPTTDSVHEIPSGRKKLPLDPIKELSEKLSHTSSSKNDQFEICTDSSDSEEIELDLDNVKNVRKMKEFRRQNYFECHSSKSRMRSSGSVTSLVNHECVYRFYLNDRLFPVPLSTDNQNNIRCVECHLPLNLASNQSQKILLNGTIQAKVCLEGDKTQNMMLLLPVKEQLVIREHRMQHKEINNELMYFGVIKLNANGHSVFKSALPNNSFALRYQKGYKVLQDAERSLRYDGGEQSNVIVL